MSNYGPQPGHPKIGDFERQCVGCEITFHTDNPRQQYHDRACKRAAQNKRHYKRHRKEIIKRNLHNQRK